MVASYEVSDKPRGGTRLFKLGGILVGLSVLLIGYSGAQMWPIFGGLLSNPDHDVPGEFRQDLDEGDYLLSVQTSSSTGGPVTFTRGQYIEVLELTITDPTGAEVGYSYGGNQTVNRNGQGFSGFAVFTVREPGTYRFELDTSVETKALVTRSLTSVSFDTFAVGGLGSVTFLIGFTLLIVGWTRRGRDRRPSTGPPMPVAPGGPPVQPPTSDWRPPAA